MLKDIYFHCNHDHFLTSVVLHRYIEERQELQSSVIFSGDRSCGCEPASESKSLIPPPSMDEFLFWQRGLHITHRGREHLIVEPETARWVILDDRFFSLFQQAQYPRPLYEMLDNPFASAADSRDFINYLVKRNILTRTDWPSLQPPVMPSPLHFPSFFSVHIIESCNFKCTYCYGDAPSSGKKMKMETMLKIIDHIVKDFSRQDITIEFHGGEPMLARNLIEAACERLREHYSSINGRTCSILVQTNASLINEKDIEFFKKYDISVGVSLDGPEEIHNRNRVYKNGKGTYHDTIRGWKLLREHRINGGILAVVERPEEYIAIAGHILSLGTTGFRLNHMVCQGRGEVDMARVRERGEAFAREFLDLLDFLADYAKSRPGLFLDIWPLNIMLFHLVNDHRPFMCMRSPCGAGSHGLGFAYNGDVYPCEQLVGLDRLKVGNINKCSSSLKQMLEESTVIEQVRSRTTSRMERCSRCPWRNFCGGGCTAEAFAVTGTLLREDVDCSFYERTFENLMWELHRRGDLNRLMGQFGQF
ncbi:MAG: radical SAM protein [Candidatus Xenobiia bacterium LiM19]